MAKKKKGKRPGGSQSRRGQARRREEKLQGPPPREAMLIRSDQERRAAERLAGYTETSPELTAGDIDADWRRAASAGEESVGGTVATPDQDRVDDIGKALGVPRGPDEEFRTSGEILESRDRNRWDDEETPGR